MILGAFSEIFSAFEKDTRKPVAIKLQNSGIDSSLMKWESHVMSSLTAMDFVPKLIHYGQEEGRDFLVMELLTGDDMSVCRDRLRRHCLNHLIPCPVAGHLILHMLANLRAMHETGFVHRDIKPSNFVRRSHSGSDFCMIDFGLAKQVNLYTFIIFRLNTAAAIIIVIPDMYVDASAVPRLVGEVENTAGARRVPRYHYLRLAVCAPGEGPVAQVGRIFSDAVYPCMY